MDVLCLSTELLREGFGVSSLSSAVDVINLYLVKRPRESSYGVPSKVTKLFGDSIPMSYNEAYTYSVNGIAVGSSPLLASSSASVRPLYSSAVLLAVLEPVPIPNLLSVT